MKKKMLFVTGLCSISLACGVIALLVNKPTEKADATEQKSLIVRDDFNASEYKDSFNPRKWSSSGAGTVKQSVPSNTYFYNSGKSYEQNGEHLFFGTKQKIYDLEYVQFDVKFWAVPGAPTEHRWLGVKFLANEITVPDVTPPDPTYTYLGPIHIADNNFDAYNPDEKGGTRTGSPTGYSAGTLAWAVGQSVYNDWMTVRFEVQSASVIKGWIFKCGEAKDDAKAVTFGLGTSASSIFNYLNCQVGLMCADKAEYAIDNFELKGKSAPGGEVLTINENFSAFNPESPTSKLGYVKSLTKAYELTGVSSLDVKNGAVTNDMLIANVLVKEDTTISQDTAVIDAKFVYKFDPSTSDSESAAFFFGLNGDENALNKTGGYLEMFKGKVYLRVLDENGNVISTDSDSVSFGSTIVDEITSSDGLPVEFKVAKDGTTTLYRYNKGGAKYIKAKQFPTKVQIYAGHVGFAAVNNITHTISFDDVLIYNSKYFIPVTKSVSHNFSNNFFGNKGYEDFYIPAACDGNIFAKDGKLNYQGCADNAFFGSAYQYDCFQLDYKLCSIKVGPDNDSNQYVAPHRWIGLDLSRKTKTLTYYGSYTNILFEIHPTSSAVYAQLYCHGDSPCDQDALVWEVREAIPASLFEPIQYDEVSRNISDIKEEDFLNIRWVSDGYTLSLFMKKNGQSEFTEYARLSGLELNGYFALSNTGYAWVQYDDFSMANTSPIYQCADNEVPETITETITETIYDDSNVDVNLEEELRINSSSKVFLITTIVLGVLFLGSTGCLVFFLLKKKKKEQPERR